MTDQPIVGERYHYIGSEPKYRDYKGLEGVATTVSKLGTFWMVELSNMAHWRGLNLGSPIFVMSTELEPAPPAAVELGVPRGVSSSALAEDEAALVADIIHALKLNGYGTCVVGQLRAKGSGTTVGYPDLSVRHPSYPRGLACLIEVKTAEGTLSTEQEDLHKDGWSHVVRSVQEALSTLLAFENEVFGCK